MKVLACIALLLGDFVRYYFWVFKCIKQLGKASLSALKLKRAEGIFI